jgi:cobalt/nickel transport protein
MKKAGKNLLLIIAVIIITTAPLIGFNFYSGDTGDEMFSGADGQAEGVITELYPDYEPWFTSLWEPQSGEIESLLFALQAAIGAGFIGYYIGFSRGKARRSDA